jgi:cytochrome c-type biogenesis protein CcmH/NrfG
LGITYWQAGELVEAEGQMRIAVRKSPQYVEAWTMLGTVLKQQNKATDAIAALQQAIRLDASSPGPHTLLGQILRAQHDTEGSRKAFAEAERLKSKKEAEQKIMFDRSRTEVVGVRPVR